MRQIFKIFHIFNLRGKRIMEKADIKNIHRWGNPYSTNKIERMSVTNVLLKVSSLRLPSLKLQSKAIS